MEITYCKQLPVWKQYDVLVCGAGPAGICAAVASARQGARTALLERYGIPGGNLTSGCVGPILGSVSSGTMRDELTALLGVQSNDMDGTTGVAHDMERAKIALTKFLDCDNLDVYLQTPVADAWMEGSRIRGVIVSTKEGLRVLEAQTVIDATGDGDVAVFAGCDYEKGREDGLMQPVTVEFTLDDVTEDEAILCIGDIDNVAFRGQRFLDWTKQQAQQGVIPENTAAVRLHPTVHKGSRQVNTTQANGVDSTKVETLYAAELELRTQMEILTDFFRRELPGYEHCKVIGSASTTGIRESRRILGDYLITGEECASGKRFADVIVHKADFLVDIHNPTGSGQADAKIQYCIPYDLPYGCFVPRKVEGLYVAGRCISGTHRAHASYRVMSICMAMGQAIGVAAAMCAQENCLPRQLEVPRLQKKLLSLGIDLFSE